MNREWVQAIETDDGLAITLGRTYPVHTIINRGMSYLVTNDVGKGVCVSTEKLKLCLPPEQETKIAKAFEVGQFILCDKEHSFEKVLARLAREGYKWQGDTTICEGDVEKWKQYSTSTIIFIPSNQYIQFGSLDVAFSYEDKPKILNATLFIEPTFEKPELVNYPSHYQAGKFEVADIIEAFDLNFNLGSVIKYVLGYENKGTSLLALKKARNLLDRQIKLMEDKK